MAAARAHISEMGAEPGSSATAALKKRYPGREAAIDLLAKHLVTGRPRATCLVYGPAGTGKTAVVRGLLGALGVRHAYVNCTEASRPRPLLCSLLHQVRGGKRQRDDGYDCGIKCDNVADFRMQLPAAVGDRRRGTCWLVLDSAQRLAGGELLSALLRVAADTGARVGVLLVGTAEWNSGQYLRDTASVLPPTGIRLGQYAAHEVQQILDLRRRRLLGASSAGEAPAFRQFLNTCVPTFRRASNNLLDIQAAVAHLFPLYMQPLREGQQLQAAQLYKRIQREVQLCLQQLLLQQGAAASAAAQRQPQPQQHVAGCADASSGGNADQQQQGVQQQGGQDDGAAARRASSSGLAFELPYISKFLLLAAYIASRNKPTSDRAVFDPTFKKRGRRDAQAHDRQVEAAAEAKLRGPHSFPLERLLHIFYAIYAHHDAEEEEGEEGGEAAQQRQLKQQAQRVMQQAEVLQQVSSLVALRLLDQSGGDVLEGQVLRCNLGEEAAAALGANVDLHLTDYLKLS